MNRIKLFFVAIITVLISFTLSAKDKNSLTVPTKEAKPETESIEVVSKTDIVTPQMIVVDSTATNTTATDPTIYENNGLVEDSEDLEGDDMGGIPAADIYPEWSNERVNPYGIRLEDSEDTISIDVSTFNFPLTSHYRVTSEFGFRRARHHYGIDLKVNIGDSVVSAFDGMVRMARTQKGGYGRYVVVRHNNGLETVYGHLNKILVEEGQVVAAGEMLGEGGNTGRSTGPHLHFEVRYLGQAVNPRDVIDFSDDKLACHSETLSLTKLNFAYVKEVEAIKHWTIRSGDTLSRVASKTGVSIARLCALNGIKKTSILRIGQRIRYN